MKKVIVVGGGAAGMMAAATASQNGDQVVLYEKNEKLGKKIYITGKGRCNLTNACDIEELFDNMVSNPKFMYSSFYCFSNGDAMDFFRECGLSIKVERGNRVFPVSDHASDVTQALTRKMKQNGVSIRLNTKVQSLILKENQCLGVMIDGKEHIADKVIVATGGISYPSTGSTGDGYSFAKSGGHTIQKCLPALVPLETKETDAKEMQGLAMKNVQVSFFVKGKKKPIYSQFGEMLFTHFGVSGPTVISASSYLTPYLHNSEVTMCMDCKPALSMEQLDARILREFQSRSNMSFKNSLNQLLPKTMIPVIIRRSGISPEKKVNEITKEQRTNLCQNIKGLTYTITGARDFKEAIITQGGISTSEIDPSTMESKKVSGLFFAGEVLDLDALTGGFNLQIAWSTGHLAGSTIE